jgi:hypothetical protein
MDQYFTKTFFKFFFSFMVIIGVAFGVIVLASSIEPPKAQVAYPPDQS